MLWVLQKGNLSLFSTNTDGCCFKWRLVLVKHDKVRDDTPLVTKVWRSSNASAVAFFSQDNLLFMYRLPIKERSCRGRLSGLFVLLCVRAEVEKWENEQNFHADYTKMATSVIRAWSIFCALSNKTHFWTFIILGKQHDSTGVTMAHIWNMTNPLYIWLDALVKVVEYNDSTAHYTDILWIPISSNYCKYSNIF